MVRAYTSARETWYVWQALSAGDDGCVVLQVRLELGGIPDVAFQPNRKLGGASLHQMQQSHPIKWCI